MLHIKDTLLREESSLGGSGYIYKLILLIIVLRICNILVILMDNKFIFIGDHVSLLLIRVTISPVSVYRYLSFSFHVPFSCINRLIILVCYTK